MQVYNVDESGLNITQHKGKVVADVKRRGVHSVVASEKGRNHTIVACGSASGYILPPMIVFPRVRVSEALKVSAPPGSMIAAQKKGWITGELYLKWFRFFLEQIPPARPVLLIQDGCSSHISIELIELAKENDVHLLCLPSHTTHILQPLDVGVFSSFKHHVGLALNTLLRSSEGRVPTSEDIPAILSEAWPKSMTPVNLMSGFRKSGIHPLNPSYIHDRVFAPSIATCPSEQSESPVPSLTEGSATTAEDGANTAEDSANMTEDNPAESVDSLETHAVSSKSPTSSLSSAMESLCLKPKLTRKTKRKAKPSYNSVAVCITEVDFVTKCKHDKEQKKKEKEKKQPKGGRKKQTSTRPTKSTSAVTASTRTKSTSDLVSARASTRAKSTSVRASTRAKSTRSKSTREQSATTSTTQLTSATRVSTRSQSRSIATSTSSKTKNQSAASARTQSPDFLNSQSESDCECAICGEHYGDRSATWIQCNNCDDWFDL